MKIITLKQPWATLIAEGYKQYEFRTWKTNYRGKLLIHAGCGVDKEAMKRVEFLHLTYPKSCIVAEVTLEDCLPLTEELNMKISSKNIQVYGENRLRTGYVWKIETIKKMCVPNIKGKLGLWSISEDEYQTKK